MAEWSEFDLDGKIWTVPAQPLEDPQGTSRSVVAGSAWRCSPRCRALKAKSRVFPGLRQHRDAKGAAAGRRRFASDGAWLQIELPRLGRQRNQLPPRSDRGMPGASRFPAPSERAYRRGEAIEKRRQVLDAWASYVSGGGKVVTLRSAVIHASLNICAFGTSRCTGSSMGRQRLAIEAWRDRHARLATGTRSAGARQARHVHDHRGGLYSTLSRLSRSRT